MKVLYKAVAYDPFRYTLPQESCILRDLPRMREWAQKQVLEGRKVIIFRLTKSGRKLKREKILLVDCEGEQWLGPCALRNQTPAERNHT